jgi:hypothetical protein
MSRNTAIEGLSLPPNHPFRRDAENLALKFDTDTTYVDAIIRWKSNNQVPPQEVLDFWKYIGKRFNMAKAKAARERETKAFLARYKANQKPASFDERNQMTGAFGKGTVVVDVFTGRRTQL